jgi:hypothetical protein
MTASYITVKGLGGVASIHPIAKKGSYRKLGLRYTEFSETHLQPVASLSNRTGGIALSPGSPADLWASGTRRPCDERGAPVQGLGERCNP